MMEYFKNNTHWSNTIIILSNDNLTVNTTGNVSNPNADDKERYVADMINIICRPILFIFGTMGKVFYILLSYSDALKKLEITSAKIVDVGSQLLEPRSTL